MTDPTTPPADRAALRDRIRRVLCEADGDGVLWGTDMLEPDEYGEVADMVLAVLPDAARYRAAWSSARRRAQAYGEGILRVVEDREQWQKWCRQAEAERPLSPYFEHPECGFRWHGRDGMDVPLRDGQPVCPRCELTKTQKQLDHSLRRREEVGVECKRRGRNVLEQAERLVRLERELDGVRDQLGKEMLRADDAGSALDRFRRAISRLAAHTAGFQDVLDESDRGPWGKTIGADIAELSRMAAEARDAGTQDNEALQCVCGDPVHLQDDADPTSWIHSPGSETRCLDARPRCPHCRMPHDLTPSMALACASVRASIRDAHPTSTAPLTEERQS
jgi:hypothetical protein